MTHFHLFHRFDVLDNFPLLVLEEFGVYLDEETPIRRMQYLREKAQQKLDRRQNAS